MKIKILNSGNEELEDFITLRAKILNGATLEEIKEDLKTLCLMEYDSALILWYYLFGAGVSAEVDNLVDKFSEIEHTEALGNVADIAHDTNGKSTQEQLEGERLILSSIKSLIKDIKNSPKREIENKKQLAKVVTENADWFEHSIDYEDELKRLISINTVKAEEVFDVIASFIHRYAKLNADAKLILKLLAGREYSQKFYNFRNLEQTKNN